MRLHYLFLFLSLFTANSTKGKHTSFVQDTIYSFVETFHKSAKTEGNTKSLNEKELEEYLRLHYSNLNHGADFARRVLESLDENQDGELDFKEFFQFHRQFLLTKHNQSFRPGK